MRVRPTVYAKAPFPRDKPTRVDLLTPLSLQVMLAPDLQVYFMRTKISYSTGKKPKVDKPITTSLGGAITPTPKSAMHLPYVIGTNPGERTYSQKEIAGDIASIGLKNPEFDIPDVIGVQQRKCSVMKKPKALEQLEEFDEWDKILLDEVACAHQSTWMSEHINLRMVSTARIARDDLLGHPYNIPYAKIPMRRMRSVLQLRSVVGVDHGKQMGWGELSSNPTVFEALADSLSEHVSYIDTAIPKMFKINTAFHPPMDLTLFRLKKHSRYISLRLGPEWKVG